MSKNPFSFRSFTAFIVTWAFLVATVTGVVLYIVPQGRIANWVDWQLLGLLKEDWGNVHLVFGAIFIAGGVLHLYFNWKPFKKYLGERISGHLHPKKELLMSLGVSLFLIVGAITQLPPFSYYFQLNEWAKQAWVTSPDVEPPFGHAEELSLAGFAKRQNMDLDKVSAELRAKGIQFEGERQRIIDIARANGMNAMRLYGLIRQLEARPEPAPRIAYTVEDVEDKFNGTGIGRKSLTTISETVGVPLNAVKDKFVSAGIEASGDGTLKAIAGKHGIDPIDLIKVILVEGFRPPIPPGDDRRS
ncbi:MAG: DUF4405 domain-containing protein [Rhodospirillales bacterium]|jgi:hypothetical protein|nr:DUF4405 domain-containing protein [Rhodospirillales bacterium]